MKVMKKGKRHSHSGEKKKNKRYREQNPNVEIIVATQNGEVDSANGMQVRDAKKEKTSINKKRKSKDKNLVRKRKPKGQEVDLDEQSDGVMYNPHCKAEEIQGLDGHRDSDTGAAIKLCRSKKDKKKRKEVQDSPEKEGEGCNQVEVYIISSVDDDCSKGMKSVSCIHAVVKNSKYNTC
ncbi:uncharacterized protein LOC114378381 isoform X2 [Glycine soja]|uniref:uncharacterized protein LOC114378381 isoform X2 n=1 Tax=Glycine soja TaxID=3848 RepID=UPI00103D14F5|nr:uncharacterized protein LOC114378381 isoform X2 [Glycine soja]